MTEGVMNGIQLKGFGGAEALQYRTDLPIPVPQDGEVLVKNDFIGINYVDVYWRIGMMGHAPEGILGREGEGTIVATGASAGDDFEIGDRVVWLSMGGYAQYTCVPVATTYKVPADVAPGVAAASLLQGLTALVLTRQILRVEKGDWVLVHAAAGGMGLWLCQLARAVGARVIGTASTAEKMELAKQNGAEFTFNYKKKDEGEHDDNEDDLVQWVKKITEGKGVRVVYDSIGRDQTLNNIEVVAEHGTIITYGASSGMPLSLPPSKLAAKKVRFVGPGEASLMRYMSTREDFERHCAELFDLVRNGHVAVKVHHIYPLADMERVHRDLEGRRTVGKVLVKP